MKLLNRIFQFYVFSNLHVSISVACLVLVTGTLFDITVFNEALFLGSTTFVAYHLIRYSNRFKYGKKHLLDRFSNQYKKLISVLNIIAFTISICTILKIQLIQVLRLLPFGIVTLFYAFSFVNIKGEKYSIRYIVGLKIFIIAFVWAGGVVFFPLEVNMQSFLYFVELLFFVVVLTIPFDIRDVLFDVGSVKTLPIILGIKKVKILGVLLLLISVGLHYFSFRTVGLTSYMVTLVVLTLLLIGSKTKQQTYYASFWVEGIPILYWILSTL